MCMCMGPAQAACKCACNMCEHTPRIHFGASCMHVSCWGERGASMRWGFLGGRALRRVLGRHLIFGTNDKRKKHAQVYAACTCTRDSMLIINSNCVWDVFRFVRLPMLWQDAYQQDNLRLRFVPSLVCVEHDESLT